ncbi:TetR/AcrR family transcriptional regulator [Phyllobacterium sp. YR531]|uniref:TetR/AcrR family transcriptional regulator n=1 Tax=Phyllobacterium sp. YR531 TaxID=1144343 RepID=UPI00026FC327|nr:TetR/AcrR family transcriptional regulator [Phyllobacterium sp. YR531]EJN06824.1 transcriptional regulator [Phyllobacterium sp. YR531]
MARLTREQSQALTREKLMASAYEVVARDGYDGATVERIAEEAGFSKGAFYSNFSSKEEIVMQLLEGNAGGDVVELGKLLSKHDDPYDVIDTLAEWSSDRASEQRWGILAMELLRRARRDGSLTKRHLDVFAEQWRGLGNILIEKLFPDCKKSVDPFLLGGTVFELTYGGISSFLKERSAGQMVRQVLREMYENHSADRTSLSEVAAVRDRSLTRS